MFLQAASLLPSQRIQGMLEVFLELKSAETNSLGAEIWIVENFSHEFQSIYTHIIKALVLQFMEQYISIYNSTK